MNNDRQRPQIKKHVIITDKEWSDRHLYDGEGWIESYWRSRNDRGWRRWGAIIEVVR